jgi:hypothetical protein
MHIRCHGNVFPEPYRCLETALVYLSRGRCIATALHATIGLLITMNPTDKAQSQREKRI